MRGTLARPRALPPAPRRPGRRDLRDAQVPLDARRPATPASSRPTAPPPAASRASTGAPPSAASCAAPRSTSCRSCGTSSAATCASSARAPSAPSTWRASAPRSPATRAPSRPRRADRPRAGRRARAARVLHRHARRARQRLHRRLVARAGPQDPRPHRRRGAARRGVGRSPGWPLRRSPRGNVPFPRSGQPYPRELDARRTGTWQRQRTRPGSSRASRPSSSSAGSGATRRGGATLDVEDPATGETIATVADATHEDADAALAAATEAFATWRNVAPRERADILRRAYDLIDARADELALLMTLEMGKPVAESQGRDRLRQQLPALVLRGGGPHQRPLHDQRDRQGPRADAAPADRAVPVHHAVELPAGDGHAQDRARRWRPAAPAWSSRPSRRRCRCSRWRRSSRRPGCRAAC